MNWETYLALGDSITIGARTYLGYPEIAGSILEKKLSKNWNIVNCAQSGITAIDFARLLDSQYEQLKAQQPSITTILIGTNDIKAGVLIEDYEIALSQIILKSKIITQNANVVIIQIPKLQKGIMYPYTIDMNKGVAAFNSSIEKIALRFQIKTLKIEVTSEDFIDGVHLNAQGVRNFGEQVSQFILGQRGF